MIRGGNAAGKLVYSNPLDEYTSEAYIFHQKFKVAPNKQTGWKRLVGQEVPVEAYSDLQAISGTNGFSAVASNLVNVNGAAASGSAVSASQNARRLAQIVNGPQTPKATQPALDLWIPLTINY